MDSHRPQVEMLLSPWDKSFLQLLDKTQQELLIASPFISRKPLEQIVEAAQRQQQPFRVNLITNLAVDSLMNGFLDLEAVRFLAGSIPDTSITYLPSLHAKMYVFDDKAAVVTSANLTMGGLISNYEYGVVFREPKMVSQVRNDLMKYTSLGSRVSVEALSELSVAAQNLKVVRSEAEKSARSKLKEVLQQNIATAKYQLMKARAIGKTTNGIFSETILYLLERRGPLTTIDLNPFIQQIHPDLCDDSIDRVIDDVHFGKKWKHYVRNAQQGLKRKGLIDFDGKCWFLTKH
jgi:hypothetical protein